MIDLNALIPTFRALTGAEGDFSVEYDEADDTSWWAEDTRKNPLSGESVEAIYRLLEDTYGTTEGPAVYFHLNVNNGEVFGFGLGLGR